MEVLDITWAHFFPPRRSIELVGLMGGRFAQGKGFFARVLFGSLVHAVPVVKSVDLLDDCIVVYNPSHKTAHMGHWTLTDDQQHSTFHFPEGFQLEPGVEVVVYCSPANMKDPDTLADYYLLWTTADGSLRRRQVLDANVQALYIFDAAGGEVSSARVLDSGAVEPGPASPRLSVHATVRRSSLLLCYIRIILLVLAGFYATQNALRVLVCYAAAFIADVFARDFSAWAGVDIMYNIMCTLGDRLSNLVLLGTLAVVYPEASRIFLGLLFLDVASYWVYGHIANAPSAVSSTVPEDVIDVLQQKYPLLLMMICLGAEIYFLFHFARGHHLLSEAVVIALDTGNLSVAYLVVTGCCVAKQILLIIQLLSSMSLSSAAVLSVRAMEQMYK